MFSLVRFAVEKCYPFTRFLTDIPTLALSVHPAQSSAPAKEVAADQFVLKTKKKRLAEDDA